MALVWLVAFGMAFNALFIIMVPIAGFGGAFAIWVIGDMRHSIETKMKNWLIGLFGAGAALAGLGIWILANAIFADINNSVKAMGMEPMGIASAAIVSFWQIAMGLVFQNALIEQPEAEKIDTIGNEE
jgi:hypothetical protein